MMRDARHRILLSLLLGVASSTLAGCAEDGAPPSVLDLRPPRLAATEPSEGAIEVPRGYHPALLFDEYLDPLPLQVPGLLALRSGGRRVALRTIYDPVRRALEVIPARPLAPDLLYRLSVEQPGAVRDLAGNALPLAPEPLTFTTGEQASGWPPLAVPAEAQRQWLTGLLARRCAACHNAAGLAGLPDLTNLQPLAGLPALTQAGRDIVVPGAPAQSYLLLKLLPDYPDRGGEAMPLSGPGLGEEELQGVRRLLSRPVWP